LNKKSSICTLLKGYFPIRVHLSEIYLGGHLEVFKKKRLLPQSCAEKGRRGVPLSLSLPLPLSFSPKTQSPLHGLWFRYSAARQFRLFMTEHRLHPSNRDTRMLRNGRKSRKIVFAHESAYSRTTESWFLCAEDRARSSRFVLVIDSRTAISYLDDPASRER
jgi:hypothetical protein